MVKWRVERGVVQQTEALVRGFYEVSNKVMLPQSSLSHVNGSSTLVKLCFTGTLENS